MLKNDSLLKEKAGSAFAQYNKDQLTPVRLETTDSFALITEHNDLGKFDNNLEKLLCQFRYAAAPTKRCWLDSLPGFEWTTDNALGGGGGKHLDESFWWLILYFGQQNRYKQHNSFPKIILGGSRFFDPRTKQSFKYDHLRKEASDFQNCEPDAVAEPWRSALDIEAIQYTANHYRHGVCSVFGRNDAASGQVTLSLCIEDHQFQPQNYWNGRWRSQWSFTFSNSGTGAAEVRGVLKVQVSSSRIYVNRTMINLVFRFIIMKMETSSLCLRRNAENP